MSAVLFDAVSFGAAISGSAIAAFNLGSLMTLGAVSLSLRRRRFYEFGCVASAV